MNWRLVQLCALVVMMASKGCSGDASAIYENQDLITSRNTDQSFHTHNVTPSSDTHLFEALQQEKKGKLLSPYWNDNKNGDTVSVTYGEDDESLGEILQDLFDEYLKGCSSTVIYDVDYLDSLALHVFLRLPNPKQIIEVKSRETFNSIAFGGRWTCRAYVFLLRRMDSLIDFANTVEDAWDFSGKYVLAGTSTEKLEQFATSWKGRKSQHIIGIIKGNRADKWDIYINRMYTNPPIQRSISWRDGQFTSRKKIFPNKISNLRGAVLKVVTFEWEPSVLYFRDKDGRMVYPFGIDIEVVSAIASVLNVTLQFVEPPPGELWGVATENGSWNGMVGMLSKNEGDIGLANLFLTLGRFGAVDYSAPYDAEVSCFLARTSPPAPKWKSLSLPFQMNVWLALLIGILSCGPVLYVLARASEMCGGENKLFQSFLFSELYTIGFHFRQALTAIPIRTNTQVFISFVGLYTFIITTAYGSNLTAFLTVIQTPSGMETIKELYKSGAEVSGLGGFFKGALASSVDPYLQGLADRFEAYGDLNRVWPQVLKGKSVYLHNRQFLEFVIATQFTEKGVSSVRIMKQCFSPYNIAMALQRHSPLKGKVDQVIGWMLESGLVRRWFLESFRRARRIQESRKVKEEEEEEGEEEEAESEPTKTKDEQQDTSVIPLTIDHLQGSFFILALGYIIGALVFGAEMCLRGSRNPKGSSE